MWRSYKHNQGLVLVAVLVTISLLTLLLMGAMADVTLMMRSNHAYWQSSVAGRQCEQLAANAGVNDKQLAIKYQERLLNTKPCAMVWTQNQHENYLVSFLSLHYVLTQPNGVCEVVVATVDKQASCVTPSLSLQAGMQSWRWLPDIGVNT